MPFNQVAIIASVLLAVIVLFQNSYNVTLRFLFWYISVPPVLLLGLAVALGFLWGYVTRRR